jgi:transglycosylase-like protein with SLT domain/FHA domain-containing protein
MGARLVQVHGEERVATTPLDDADLLVGRDAEACTLVLDSSLVSRQHLLIRPSPEGWTAVDLGSANGTLLNGTPLAEPTLLASGDVLELAGDTRFVFEQDEDEGGTGTDRKGTLLVFALAAIVIALVAFGVWRWRRSDAVFDQAAATASDGLKAAELRDWPGAKAKLQSAAGLLLSNGRLDDVPREMVMQVAMERLGDRLSAELGRPVDLPTVFRNAVERSRPPSATPSEGPACRMDEVAPSELRPCLEERVGLVLRGLRQSSEGVPASFYQDVGARMRKEHDFIERSLARGEPLVPMLREELVRAKMPELLHYLAMIESGYQTDIGSPAGALGLWQFMPATAKRYGLRMEGGVDERRDPRRSTEVAARYLRDLAFEFGGDALLLALAGYNRGENGVRTALKRMSDPFSDRSYWRLVESNLLPIETADYVPRFMAAAVAGEGGLPSDDTLAAAGF